MDTQLSVALATSGPATPPADQHAQGVGMRQLLARHFWRDASVAPTLEHSVASSGAPRLRVNGEPVCISLSHTACALAVATAPSAVGVDVEASDRLAERPARAVALAARLWPPHIASALRARPEKERGALFVRLWTLFEAAAKRAETGIWRTPFSLSPGQIEALFGPMPPQLVWLPRERADACALATVSLPGGVTLALAAQAALDVRFRVHASHLAADASLGPLRLQ